MNAQTKPAHISSGFSDRLAMIERIEIVTLCDENGWLIYTTGASETKRAVIRERHGAREIELFSFGWQPLSRETHPITAAKIATAIADVRAGRTACVPMPAPQEIEAYAPKTHQSPAATTRSHSEMRWRSENLQHRDYN